MGVWLTATQAIAYAGLTTEALAMSLPGITAPSLESGATSTLHAAGSSFAGLPAAFAVVRCSSGSAFEVLSLVVAEPFRRLGLARALLQWLVIEAQHFGYSSIAVSFPGQHASTFAMERLTPSRQGPDQVLLGDGISAFDAAVSHVLLDEDQPAGWLIAHRVGSSLGRVTAWWVRPDLQGRGLALMLLKPAIAMGLEREPAFASCSFGIAADNLTTDRSILQLRNVPVVQGMERFRQIQVKIDTGRRRD